VKKFKNSGDIKLWYYAHDIWYVLCADRELASYLETGRKFKPYSFVFRKDDCIGWVYQISALEAKKLAKELQIKKDYKGPLPGRDLYTKFFDESSEERKPEEPKKLTKKQELEETRRIARLKREANKDEINKKRRSEYAKKGK
jgi:hypothetical protein